MNALGGLPVLFRNFEPVLDVNPFDDEHTILTLFDFSTDLAFQLSVRLNFARLQRASEGSE